MDTTSNTILILSYYYPPIAAAGTHRIMNISKELKALGWNVHVVSCSDFARNPVDHDLMSGIGSGIKVRRAPSPDIVEIAARIRNALLGSRRDSGTASKDRSASDDRSRGVCRNANGSTRSRSVLDYISRLVKTPDSMLSFIPGAVIRALPVMMSSRPDVIFSSAPPYSCHLAALFLRSLFPVQWVADFRDPWADNPFKDDNPFGSLERLNLRLEEMVIRGADLVVSNTKALEERFRHRYPNTDRFVTLNNGFDPKLVRPLDALPQTGAEGAAAGSGKLSLVHTGNIYGLRSPRHLIAGLASLEQGRSSSAGQSLGIEFYGDVDDEDELREQARSLGMEDAVFFGGRVSHADALKHASEADILLLLGVMGDTPEIQVPSKLFEYFALKKPIVSLSKPGGAIHRLLKESGVPYLLADLDDEAGITRALERAIENDFDGGDGWAGVKEYAVDRLVGRLSTMLVLLTQGKVSSICSGKQLISSEVPANYHA